MGKSAVRNSPGWLSCWGKFEGQFFNLRTALSRSARMAPECKKIVERIIKIKGAKAKDIQVAFLAVNKKGQVGSYAIHKGFSYAIRTTEMEKLVNAKSMFD